MDTQCKADAKHARAEDDREKVANCYRQSREGRQDNKDAEENKGARARHGSSISGRHYDDKFPSNRIWMCSKMFKNFAWCTRDDLLMHLGELAGNNDVRHLVLHKLL